MAYILPRAVLVLMACGITCGLIVTVLPDADSAVFLFAGISWALAGVVCFGYIRKLRHDNAPAQRRTTGNTPNPTF